MLSSARGEGEWWWWLGNRGLRLIVLTTERCNFRCVYCYERFREVDIGRQVIEGIKALIKRRVDELEFLHLSFFGGEPLLRRGVVEELAGFARDVCGERGVGFVSDVTTNGYLLSKQMVARLVACGVKRFQVTVDGLAEKHDRLRPLAGGRGTYWRVVGNLLEMHRSGLEFWCILRFNVCDENYWSVVGFLEHYAGQFGRDGRFCVHFHHVFGSDRYGFTDAQERLHSLREHARQLGYRLYEERSTRCYAALANNYVIFPDGRVGKCTVALYEDFNKVGELSPDGTLRWHREKLLRWLLAKNKRCPLEEMRADRQGALLCE